MVGAVVVTPADRRLAALAAVMAPAVAERLLGRLCGGERAAAATARLAAESRAVRLAALAEALERDPRLRPQDGLRAVMAAEHPCVAAALEASAPPDIRGETLASRLAPAPILARLCLERLESLLRPT